MESRNCHTPEHLNSQIAWLNVHVRRFFGVSTNLLEDNLESILEFRPPVGTLSSGARIEHGRMSANAERKLSQSKLSNAFRLDVSARDHVERIIPEADADKPG